MKQIFTLLMTTIISVLLITNATSLGTPKGDIPSITTLRSQPETLAKDALLKMVKEKGFCCPSEKIKGTFKHNYELQTIQGIKVVVDQATALMWQQAEEKSRITWQNAEAYLEQTNKAAYAGFSDWRIPTVEEAMSLMESKNKNEFYIDPIFSKSMLSTWTADIVKDAFAGAWFIDFRDGRPGDGNRAFGMGDVRLVRSMTPLLKK